MASAFSRPAAIGLLLALGCPSPESREAVSGESTPAAAGSANWGALDISVSVAGEAVEVDLFVPEGAGPFPVVVVAHGFKRSRARMAGWGQALAERGFVVAVPNLPGGFAIDHEQNARIVSELLDWLAAASHPELEGSVDRARRGLMGYSAGGLAVMLAAPSQPELDLLVLLDGVDRDGLGARAATKIAAPVVALRAEPDDCNAGGNGVAMAEASSGPHLVVPVTGATHCDPEWPSDTLCATFCGGPSEARQVRFRERALRTFEFLLACAPDEGSAPDQTLPADVEFAERLRGPDFRPASGCAGRRVTDPK